MKKLIAIALCAMTLFATFAAIPVSAKPITMTGAVCLEAAEASDSAVRSPLLTRVAGSLLDAANTIVKTTAANGLMSYAEYDQRVRPFLTDSRFTLGTTWTSSQTPKLSSHSCSGCCAFAADFVAYVFGHTSRPWTYGEKYYNASEIRAGDVLYFVNGDHWVVCVERIGDQLYTLEGNWGGKVVLSNNAYTVNNGIVYRNGSPFRTFCWGLHYVA